MTENVLILIGNLLVNGNYRRVIDSDSEWIRTSVICKNACRVSANLPCADVDRKTITDAEEFVRGGLDDRYLDYQCAFVALRNMQRCSTLHAINRTRVSTPKLWTHCHHCW